MNRVTTENKTGRNNCDGTRKQPDGAAAHRQMLRGIIPPGGLGRANGMNEETRKKYQRLNDRLNELNMLNGNIAKLAFYLNENDVDNVDRSILNLQLKFMREYLQVLQERIVTGCY